jgi:hypothetical protein
MRILSVGGNHKREIGRGGREKEERRGDGPPASVNWISQMTWCYAISLGEGNNVKSAIDRSLSLVMDTLIASFTAILAFSRANAPVTAT